MFKKVIICFAGLAVVALLYFGVKTLTDTSKYKKIISEIVIITPDMSQIQDGTYNGFFDAILVAADVDVTVKDHKITEIEINKHKNDRGANAEVITEEVIIKQSLEVDAVSGATNSCKVILKAVENALENRE